MFNKKAKRKLVLLLITLFPICPSATIFNSNESQFPVAMTFRAFDRLKPNSTPFNNQLLNHKNYPIIHAPGPKEKSNVVKSFWPNKVMTIQGAYGGVNTKVMPRVWPGHLLYKPGTLLSQSISTTDNFIAVENLALLTRGKKSIEMANKIFPLSLVIYKLNEQRKPNWNQAELLILDDYINGKLKVQRGQLGTKPLSFDAGKAVVATPMMFWSKQWQLNLSLDSPRGGPDNLTASEWYAQELANRVKESNADGIELDVGRWTWGFPKANPMDVNNDLIADFGYLQGINSFGLGGRVLFHQLRKHLGPNKIIQVDSNSAAFGVRGWRDLNGVQLESFPGANDYHRFSEAFLHLRLWVENAENHPRFSYPFTKTPTAVFEKVRSSELNTTNFRFRVGLAAACLVSMPHPFASITHDEFDPANNITKNLTAKPRFGVFDWDEYHAGTLNKWQWLGKPITPAIQHFDNLESINLLDGNQWKWRIKKEFIASKQSSPNIFSVNVLKIPEGNMPLQSWFGVKLEPKIPTQKKLEPNKEYTLEFKARGDDVWNYAGEVFDQVPRMIAISGSINTRNKRPLSVLVDSKLRTYRISFITNDSNKTTPIFGVSEQIGKTEISQIKLYRGGVERWSREFENGLVLLNMTKTPWHFPVENNIYKRLVGKQDPLINNGNLIHKDVVVPANDAVFLIKRKFIKNITE